MAPNGCWKNVAKFKDNETGLWTSFQLGPTHDLLFERDEYLSVAHRVDLERALRFQYWRKLAEPEYRAMMVRKMTGNPRFGDFVFVLAMCEQEGRDQGMVGELNRQVNLHWQVSERACGALRRSLISLERWLGCDLHLAPGEVKNRV